MTPTRLPRVLNPSASFQEAAFLKDYVLGWVSVLPLNHKRNFGHGVLNGVYILPSRPVEESRLRYINLPTPQEVAGSSE